MVIVGCLIGDPLQMFDLFAWACLKVVGRLDLWLLLEDKWNRTICVFCLCRRPTCWTVQLARCYCFEIVWYVYMVLGAITWVDRLNRLIQSTRVVAQMLFVGNVWPFPFLLFFLFIDPKTAKSSEWSKWCWKVDYATGGRKQRLGVDWCKNCTGNRWTSSVRDHPIMIHQDCNHIVSSEVSTEVHSLRRIGVNKWASLVSGPVGVNRKEDYFWWKYYSLFP